MARTDFEPLTWEEAEDNRRECLEEHFSQIPQGHAVLPRALPHGLRRSAPQVLEAAGVIPGESTAESCDRLRGEIKRGREYLEQAERDLAESRDQLESWPVYEQVCGKNPLAHLTQCVMVSERIARFLSGWLERRQAELQALSRQAEGAANPRKGLLQRPHKARFAA